MNLASQAKLRHPAFIPYMYSIIGLGGIAILYAAWQLLKPGTNHQWIILAALTIVTSIFSIKIPTVNSKISIVDTLYFTNVILFGPAAGIITAVLDGLVSSLRCRTKARRLQYACFNMGALAISALVGGTIFFHLLGQGPLYSRPLHSTYDIFFPLGVLAFTHYLCNSGTVAIIVALESRKNVFEIWLDGFLWTSITYFAGAGAAGLVAATIGSITPQVFAVAVPAVLAVYFTYKTYLNKVQEVRSLAYYDSLTSLPNRVLFKQQLDQAIASSQQYNQNIALMFLDLDNFKRINDTYGHCVGDLLVQSVGARLAANVRMEDRGANEKDVVIGRFGGDEFTVMMTGIDGPQEAGGVAERLLQAFASPFALDGHEVSIAASVGISIYPLDGTDADTLLKNADTAMFYAKANERSSYHFYSQSMNQTSPQKLSMENDLRKALRREEFRVYYQPKADTRMGTLMGAEALIRWQHPTRGLLTAAEFIMLAEETGLIKPMGEWVLRTVCAQISAWQRNGLPPVPIAVNLSAVQLRQKDLAQMVSQVLQETNLEASWLELEITESAIMQNEEEADRSLRELRALGVTISIDDFGLGYSSLSRLKRFAVDSLKIDRSFVADLADNPDDRAIATAIIAMASSLRLKVIAEGVDTEKQLQFLREQGCDEVQGWLPGRPMPADELAKLLEEDRRFQPLFAERFSPSTTLMGNQGFTPGQDWHGSKRSGSRLLHLVSNRQSRSAANN